MSFSVEVPPLGESITEAIIAVWNKTVGDFVAIDEILVEFETDKVSVELPSPVAGVIVELKGAVDDTVNIGDVIAVIDTSNAPSTGAEKHSAPHTPHTGTSSLPEPPTAALDGAGEGSTQPLSPAVERLVSEHSLDAGKIPATGPHGRLLKGDVLAYIASKPTPQTPQAQQTRATAPMPHGERTEHKRMSKLRQTIAKRLVEVKQTTAMLTTFNEVDMSNVLATRKQYQDRFIKRHGTKLGFMSFFVKAVIEALKEFPAVNSQINGNEQVFHNFYDIGIAVGGGRGLVVPVVRNADLLSFSGVELEIKRLALLAMDNKLSLSDLQGGTFTITNGGIYGSMLSTPILNPPQSAILGMHNIVERAVVVDGEVVVRPIMYLALSYDHRIVDGREAVSFLVRIKECIERPERILFEV